MEHNETSGLGILQIKCTFDDGHSRDAENMVHRKTIRKMFLSVEM